VSASKVQQDIGGRGLTHAFCVAWMDTKTGSRRGTEGHRGRCAEHSKFNYKRCQSTIVTSSAHALTSHILPPRLARARLHPRIGTTVRPHSSAAVSSPHVPRISSPPHPFSSCALPPRHSPVHRATPHIPSGGLWARFLHRSNETTADGPAQAKLQGRRDGHSLACGRVGLRMVVKSV
jgi:hypothetical protein